MTRRSKDLWQRAAAFAARAHQHHTRKDDVTPYVSHPMRVALTVACVFGETGADILAAALLHDTIEDTGVDYDDLEEEFGRGVADLVAALSKDARLRESKRETAYDAQLAAAPWPARLIKLADVYDNYLDCANAKSRSKQREKMQRAIALAGSDRRLAKAVAAVKSLLKHSPAGEGKKKSR